MTEWDEFQEEIKDATDKQLRLMKRDGSPMVVRCVLGEMAGREKELAND